MDYLLIFPAVVCFITLAAHFFFHGSPFLTGLSLMMIFLLFVRTRYVLRTMQVLLLLACVEWGFTAVALVQQRIAAHDPDVVLPGVILGVVAVFNLFAAALFQTRRLKDRYAKVFETPSAGVFPPPEPPA